MAAPTRRPRTKIGSPRIRGRRSAQRPPNAVTHDALPALPRPATLAEARKQTEELRGQLLQLDLAIRQGELVRREDRDREWFTAARTIHNRILALPARLSAELHAAGSVAEAQRVLARELRQALEDLANDLDR